MVEPLASGDRLDAAQFGDFGEEGGPGVDQEFAGGRIAGAQRAEGTAALQGAARLRMGGEERVIGGEFGVVAHEEEVHVAAGGASGELRQAVPIFAGSGIDQAGEFRRGDGLYVVLEEGHDRHGVDAHAGQFEKIVVVLATVDPGLGGAEAAPQIGADVQLDGRTDATAAPGKAEAAMQAPVVGEEETGAQEGGL